MKADYLMLLRKTNSKLQLIPEPFLKILPIFVIPALFKNTLILFQCQCTYPILTQTYLLMNPELSKLKIPSDLEKTHHDNDR